MFNLRQSKISTVLTGTGLVVVIFLAGWVVRDRSVIGTDIRRIGQKILTRAPSSASPDGLTNWVQLSPTGGPPGARHAHLLAYDSNLNELIASGGCAGGCLPLATDMWSLSNADGLDQTTTPTWTSRGAAPNPGFGSGQFGAVDSANHVLVIFGGQNGGGSGCATSGNTETVNTSTFSVATLSTTGGPPGERYFPKGGYDPATSHRF